MINSSRVLVLAMLSSASGWGLPSHDPLLSWNDTGEVDGARDQRQLQYSCTGITTEANSPFGAYAAEGVTVTFFTPITNLNAVPFTLELSVVDGGQPRDFDGGAFEGSARRVFSLQGAAPPAAPFALNNLDIEFCPNQNYFQVATTLPSGVTVGPNTLRWQGSSGSSCNVVESWSVLPAPRATLTSPP